MKDVFNLEKDSFTLVPELDWVCYFGRGEAEQKVQFNVVDKALSANRPPKAVILGDWGTGKTQTLWHFIKTALKDHKAVYVELPELPPNTDFRTLYNELMTPIPPSYLRKIGSAIKSRYASFRDFFVKQGGPGEEKPNVFKIFEQLILTTEGSVEEGRIYSWLCGNKIASPSRIGLAEGAERITVEEATKVLWMLGKMSLEVDRKYIIFCVDESHRLKDITEGKYPERTFIQAFRTIFLKDFPVGFLFSCGVGDLRDLPHMLAIGEVRTRLRNYIVLGAMSKPELKEIITGIIKYVRDGATWDYEKNQISWKKPRKKVENVVKKLSEKGVDISLQTYPFTSPAISQMITYLLDKQYSPHYRVPRRISDCLDFIASEKDALEKGYIDKDLVMSAFPKYIEVSPVMED